MGTVNKIAKKSRKKDPKIADQSDGMVEYRVPKGVKFPSKRSRRWGGDKILDNSYNRGDTEFEEFNKVEVEHDFSDRYLDSSYNSHEYFRNRSLYGMIDRVYSQTSWNDEYGWNKRIPKGVVPGVYDHIVQSIDMANHTHLELFYAIADYLDLEEGNLYDSIGPAYKEKVLMELEEKTGILHKKRIKKLF